jgi:hypothetical protein
MDSQEREKYEELERALYSGAVAVVAAVIWRGTGTPGTPDDKTVEQAKGFVARVRKSIGRSFRYVPPGRPTSYD